MRKSLDVAWVAGHQPKAGVVCLALAVAIPLLAGGCSKKSDTSATNLPEPPPAASTVDSTAAAPATPAPVATSTPLANTATNALPDLRPLNQALLGWRVQNRRVPASFEEFAASAGIQIPAPPPGKKYIINSHGLISLVNAN